MALPCIHLLISQQYYGIRKCTFGCVLLCGFTEMQSTGSEAKCSQRDRMCVLDQNILSVLKHTGNELTKSNCQFNPYLRDECTQIQCHMLQQWLFDFVCPTLCNGDVFGCKTVTAAFIEPLPDIGPLFRSHNHRNHHDCFTKLIFRLGRPETLLSWSCNQR